MKRKNVIIPALVLAIALTGCSGKKVDYNMETENINTKAGSDISAFINKKTGSTGDMCIVCGRRLWKNDRKQYTRA